MCLRVSYKKKNEKSHRRKESDLELDPEPNLNPLVRCTDPRNRIRTKMSQIPNTAPNPWKSFATEFKSLKSIATEFPHVFLDTKIDFSLTRISHISLVFLVFKMFITGLMVALVLWIFLINETQVQVHVTFSCLDNFMNPHVAVRYVQ